jgi:hypothetical protein
MLVSSIFIKSLNPKAVRGGMRLVTTQRGYIGKAHPQVQKGDHICLLEGMSGRIIPRPYEGTAEEVQSAKQPVIALQQKNFWTM